MANGATEKANSTIKKTLSHLSEEDRFCWDKQVSLTCLAINTSYQVALKRSHFSFTTVEMRACLSTILSISYLKLITLKKTMRPEMSLRLSQAFTHVKTMSQRSRDSAVKYYNRKVAKEAKKISIGSLVLLKNETGGRKLLLAGLLAMSAHTVLPINSIIILKSAVCLLTKGFKQFMPIGLN